MFLRADEVGDYFNRLSRDAKKDHREATIEAAILEQGYWEEHVEWRISTVTSSRIEPVEKDGRRWFKVTVTCDSSMSAHCPTLARAIEYAGVFRRLQKDLFASIGWPSWASKTKLEP